MFRPQTRGEESQTRTIKADGFSRWLSVMVLAVAKSVPLHFEYEQARSNFAIGLYETMVQVYIFIVFVASRGGNPETTMEKSTINSHAVVYTLSGGQ